MKIKTQQSKILWVNKSSLTRKAPSAQISTLITCLKAELGQAKLQGSVQRETIKAVGKTDEIKT